MGLVAKLKNVLWIPLLLITAMHLLALIGSYHAPLKATGCKAFLTMYTLTGLGITAGYHRHWSHVAYGSHRIWQAWWAFWGAGSLQGSIIWWSRLHRLHHKYTDTNWDPYSAFHGFWHAHLLWMFRNVDRTSAIKTLDLTDLTEDALVAFQHRHYVAIGMFCAFVVPVLMFSSDIPQAVVYGVFWARLFTWHSTWCVNSVAHWLGNNDFSDVISAKDHMATSLVTFGEGNHGFHHAFADSYKNGINWYDYDPTGWLIALFSKIGITFKLTHPEQNHIELTKYLTFQNRAIRILREMQKKVEDFPDMEALSSHVIGEDQVEVAKAQGKYYLFVDNWVHDVTEFRLNHPGGRYIMEKYCFNYDNNAVQSAMPKGHMIEENLQALMRFMMIGYLDENLRTPSSSKSRSAKSILPSMTNIVDKLSTNDSHEKAA